MEVSDRFEDALIKLDRVSARELMLAGVKKHNRLAFVAKTAIPALENIGRGWESGKYALSQVYMSGVICEELVDDVLPPADPQRVSQPAMAIVVLEDFHVLGSRIVYSILRASGYEIEDFGYGCSLQHTINKCKQHGTKVLLVSVLMLRSALLIRALVESLKKEKLDIKVVVGGAPFRFDPELWKEVGADAVGKDGTEARRIVTRILAEMT